MIATLHPNSEGFSDDELHRLIDQLSSNNGLERQEARRKLVNYGRNAEAPLMQTLAGAKSNRTGELP